jgi:hypothetical protein
MISLGRFGIGKAKPEPEVSARIKEWLRRALRNDEATTYVVNEIICNDPGCIGTETIMLLMHPHQKTRALKVLKPMAEVTELDVHLALAAPSEGKA